MKSLHTPAIDCSGNFNYTNLPNGKAVFNCTNNEKGFARIKLDGNLTGTGRGTSSFGKVQLAYGYSLNKMNMILKFPENKILVANEQEFKLMDRVREK